MFNVLKMLIFLFSWFTNWGLAYIRCSLTLGLHDDTLEIRVENRVEIIAKCLRVNRLDSSVAGIL
jgi:hypothetical protein